jgi:hypothetical protein
VYHPISCRYLHLTLQTCVSAAGHALTPIRDSLWSHSFRQDEDTMMRHRNLPYINEEYFYEERSATN